MYKIAICDDIPIVANLTERLILDYPTMKFNVDVFNKPSKLIGTLGKQKYDFYLLDIDFPSINGVEVAELIRQYDLKVPIVFVTSFKEYMEEVFKVHTFDYILKPISKKKLYPVLDRIVQFLNLDSQIFIFENRKSSITVDCIDILYFEKCKRQVILVTKDQKFVFNSSTQELLKKLDNSFVQIHTSFIVNLRHIRKVSSNMVTLDITYEDKDSINLPISRKYKEEAKKEILKFMRKRI